MPDTPNPRKFMIAILGAAADDDRQGVPDRHKSNTGDRLRTRLNLDHHRSFPRCGDGKYARSIYTAARWLITTERDD